MATADAISALAQYQGPSRQSDDIVTEDAAARRFAELFVGRLRYCHDTGAWFKWDGAIWRKSRTGEAFHWAREVARGLAASQPEKARYTISRTAFATGVDKFARCDPVFATTADYWDRDTFLLGTPGGTVDLKTGALRTPLPEDGITKSTAVAPSTQADCPIWRRFLEETTGGDANLIGFLRQWAGYALTGDTREQALLFVFGPGGNGKTVFVNAIRGILGEYAVVAAMDVFISSNSDRHPADLAMLQGARLVTASETEEGRQWAESRIKQVTGGDPITARFMRQNFFTFQPRFKLTIIGNHKPALHNVDDAQRRRFNLVEFTRKPAAPDLRLEEKLKGEWPGILRWMIDGCLDWQTNGLRRPDSVVEATAVYFDDQDLFAQWLAEECDAEPGNPWKNATSSELFRSWQEFAIRAGEKPSSQKSFVATMQQRGFERKKGTNGVRLLLGVRLNPRLQHEDY
jgi:putative DNA primase/helicase